MLTLAEMKERWQGIVVPLVTVFKEDLSLDLPALESNVQWLMDKGAGIGNSIFLVAGSGGDFSVMTTEERKEVIKTVAEVADGKTPLIASAQSTDIRDCIEICNCCADNGYDCVQISGPYYYDGRPGDAMAWVEEVSKHTDVGFAIYNNWYTGYDMPLDLIDEMLEIKNSVAVKWGSPNVFTYMEGVHRFSPKAVVVDNALLPVLSYLLGIRAFISHELNFCPEHAWRVIDYLRAGKYEEAQSEYDRYWIPWSKLIGKVATQTGGEAVFVRPAMEAAGRKAGFSRLPSRDAVITEELREGFRKLVADLQI
jgi:4-hydroxy-tetrahydrodipicolinate synthase